MRCFCLRAVLALALANFGLSAGCLPADKKWKAGNYLWLLYLIGWRYLKLWQKVFLWQGSKIRSSSKHWNPFYFTLCFMSLMHSWGKTLVIIMDLLVFSSRKSEYCWMAQNRGNLGKRQKESGQHKKTRGWWRWRWRGNPPPLACSISACLNRPVRSWRLKQMQIALTCLQKKKKNPEGFSNQLALTMVGWTEQGGYTVWALNGTMCERGAVK